MSAPFTSQASGLSAPGSVPASSDSSTASRLVRIPPGLLRDRRLKRAELVTLTALGRYADEAGLCWPSRASLAADTGYSLGTISRATARLQELGYLTKEGNGVRKPVRYRLRWDAPPAPPCAPAITPCVPSCAQAGGDHTMSPGTPKELSKELLPVPEPAETDAIGAETPSPASLRQENRTGSTQSEEKKDRRGEEGSTASESDGRREPRRQESAPAARAAPKRPTPVISAESHPEERTTAEQIPLPADSNPDANAGGARISGSGERLAIPADLGGLEPAFVVSLVAVLASHTQRQAVIDEFSARCRSGGVRRPRKYLEKLVRRARIGRFTLSAGIAVAEERRRRTLRHASNAALRRVEEASVARFEAMGRMGSPGLLPTNGPLGAALARLTARTGCGSPLTGQRSP